ncbi:MAG: hypothetical protein WCA35_24935 [Kovacikia sp.]
MDLVLAVVMDAYELRKQKTKDETKCSSTIERLGLSSKGYPT